MDDLAALVWAVDYDNSFTVAKILKVTPAEKTELVYDRNDNLFVRKQFSRDTGLGTGYRLLQTIASPYLPRIFNCYSICDQDVVIMQYLQGPTARELVSQNGSLQEETAMRILTELCQAVQELHNATGGPIIHRDINPSNVLLCPDSAKLIDFGIAHTFKEGKDTDTHHWGTRAYAAPEQYGFRQTDERTDIYALGLLLYYLLTGFDPQRDANGNLLWDARIPESLRRIIDTCTKLDPGLRFKSLGELQEVLSRQRCGVTHASHISRNRRLGKALWIIWLIVANVTFFTLAVATIAMIFNQPFEPFSRHWMASALQYLSLLLLVVRPLYVLLTDFGHLVSNLLPVKHRVLQVISVILISFILTGIAIAGADSLHSDEYQQTQLSGIS